MAVLNRVLATWTHVSHSTPFRGLCVSVRLARLLASQRPTAAAEPFCQSSRAADHEFARVQFVCFVPAH